MDWITIFGIIIFFLLMLFSLIPKKELKFYAFVFSIYSFIALGCGMALTLFPFRPFDYRNAFVACKFGLWLISLLDCRYDIEGLEKIDPNKGGIVILNHQSFTDIIVLARLWNKIGPVTAIAKKEFMRDFPVGISIYCLGNTFIDRSQPNKAMESINRVAKTIKKENKKLIFFPEGTRSKSDKLLKFKKGAFITAMNNKCDIFPIVVSKLNFYDDKKKEFYGGTGKIKILDPVKATDFDQLDALVDHCQELMQSEFDKINKEIVT